MKESAFKISDTAKGDNIIAAVIALSASVADMIGNIRYK